MKFSQTFLAGIFTNDKTGMPSSKRILAYIITLWAMAYYSFNPLMPLEALWTWLGMAAGYMGMTLTMPNKPKG